MSNYVLDASALLALFNQESGGERVLEIVPDSVVGAVNLCETAGKLISAGMSLRLARTSIELLHLEVIPFDQELAYLAGALAPEGKNLGLSLGDRACLALGMLRKQTVVTAERRWSTLNIGAAVELIR